MAICAAGPPKEIKPSLRNNFATSVSLTHSQILLKDPKFVNCFNWPQSRIPLHVGSSGNSVIHPTRTARKLAPVLPARPRQRLCGRHGGARAQHSAGIGESRVWHGGQNSHPLLHRRVRRHQIHSNYYTGALAQPLRTQKPAPLGWVLALPIPILLIFAPNWYWVVGANVLLGIHQGLCWSSTVVMKIDLVGHKDRGLAMG